MKKIIVFALIASSCHAMEKSQCTQSNPKRLSLEKQKKEIEELLSLAGCISVLHKNDPHEARKMYDYIIKRMSQISYQVIQTDVSNSSLSIEEMSLYIMQALDNGIENKEE